MATVSRTPQSGTELQEQLLGARERRSEGGNGLIPSHGQPLARLQPPNLRLSSLRALCCLGALVVLASGFLLVAHLLIKGGSEISYGMLWLLFAVAAPVTWLIQKFGATLLSLRDQACVVVVGLRNTGCKWDRCLMEALLDAMT